MATDPAVLTSGPEDDPATGAAAPPDTGGRLRRWFGPLTPFRLVVLLLAVGFLGGALGYTLRDLESRGAEVDVGFLRDMSTHHSQAVLIARTALASDLPEEVALYAEEVVIRQQYELGLMQATLYRLGADPAGDGTAMGWMGMSVPEDQMAGLASPEELSELESLEGEEAAELFFALMTRHHLGGLHMAQAAAEAAEDPYVRGLAERMASGQQAEVLEYRAARQRLGIGLPEGYPETPDIGYPDADIDTGGDLPVVPLVGAAVVGLVLLGAWFFTRRSTLDGVATDERPAP